MLFIVKLQVHILFLEESEKRDNYHYYDLHDGKMLYLLTQHSMWNRKEHPFLICDCKRGEGVVNNEHHQCNIINNDDQVKLYEKSKKKFMKYETKAKEKGKE